jgi:hypothetical protein
MATTTISGGPPRGAVLSMNRPNLIRGFTKDLQFRVVRLERESLERQLSTWLDRELKEPVHFEFPLPADTRRGPRRCLQASESSKASTSTVA